MDTLLKTDTGVFTLDNTPAVGDVNDYIAVYLVNSSNKYSPFAVKAGNAVTTAASSDCDAAHWNVGAATASTDATYRF